MEEIKATFNIIKNNTTSLNGHQAWRINYITNLSGQQSSYESKIYVVNGVTLYTISFFTDPLEVQKTLPIFEKILFSFIFT